MIARAIVEQIRQLLGEQGLSQRQIARHLGVSRGTVLAIAQGRRPNYAADNEGDKVFSPSMGPPRRCPGCGGMVTMQCLLCKIRGLVAVDRRRRAG